MPAKKKNKQVQINLLPREDFDKTTLGRILKWSLTTFRYIVILVELIVVAGFLSRFYFDVQISDLNDEIKQQSAVIDARSSFENDFRTTQLKLSVLSTISDDSNSMLPIINKVSSYLNPDMKLNSLSKMDDSIDLVITTFSERSMNNFMNLLLSDPAFENIALKNIQQDEDSVNFEYTLTANIIFENLTD